MQWCLKPSLGKSMKLLLNLSLLVLSILIFEDKSVSLTNYQIKKLCRKEKKESTCIKFLKEKKLNLEKGKLIEIPVIPYKN